MWIDKGPLGPKQSPLSVLPYYGKGYYGRAAAAFMLDAGIVTWAEIKETYRASARRPMTYATERLKLLEKILLKVGASFAGDAFSETEAASHAPRCLRSTVPWPCSVCLPLQSRTATN